MPLTLETARLILRPFRETDILTFSEYRSDPEVARYQGWEAPYEPAQAAHFILSMQQVQPGTPGQWYQLALQIKPDGPMIGDCGFCVLGDSPRQAEIGYTLARPYQGQGYATEAVTRVLDYLFRGLSLHRVRANCDASNLASARLLERVGMRREAHTIESTWFKGKWGSDFWYAILRREWLARSGAAPLDI